MLSETPLKTGGWSRDTGLLELARLNQRLPGNPTPEANLPRGTTVISGARYTPTGEQKARRDIEPQKKCGPHIPHANPFLPQNTLPQHRCHTTPGEPTRPTSLSQNMAGPDSRARQTNPSPPAGQTHPTSRGPNRRPPNAARPTAHPLPQAHNSSLPKPRRNQTSARPPPPGRVRHQTQPHPATTGAPPPSQHAPPTHPGPRARTRPGRAAGSRTARGRS